MPGSRILIPSSYSWKAQKFTASGSFVAPGDLQGGVIFVSGCAAGGGGSGGDAGCGSNPDDYANGGGGGSSCWRLPIPMDAGQTMAITISVPGVGGAGATRNTTGITHGTAGTGAGAVYGIISGKYCFYLRGGGGGAHSTGGGGAGGSNYANLLPQALVSPGSDGADDTGTGYGVTNQIVSSDGADDSVGLGGHAGGSCGWGYGGNGGDGNYEGTGAVTAGNGYDGNRYGGGGGGGGNARGIAGYDVTGGDGGDGGPGLLIVEWLGRM